MANETIGAPPSDDRNALALHQRNWNGRFLGQAANEWIVGGMGPSNLSSSNRSNDNSSGGSGNNEVGGNGNYLYGNSSVSNSSINTIPIMDRDETAIALQEAAARIESNLNGAGESE